ncbi:uncharacterized protein B0T15DRAFT_223217 [Chaetomium strumarium]|uniref:Secreted protein n=1 Tax=Chaetomium strumarium TaxID=1170767 RepID=A0AAJ0GPT2_9PEZI|nr:hypothetical protein B0T15DRAFT_223217 [Chaetomium strumarium]
MFKACCHSTRLFLIIFRGSAVHPVVGSANPRLCSMHFLAMVKPTDPCPANMAYCMRNQNSGPESRMNESG